MKKQTSEKKGKSIKSELLYADIALFVLGLLMVIFKRQISTIICVALGLILGIWGIIRLVKYFASDKTEVFSSFGLAQGVALFCFGLIFVIKPDILSGIVSILLAVILIITGVMKLQYAVDMMKLKTKLWLVPLVGALVSIALGVLSFIYTDMSWLMLFIGIALMITAVWDLLSVSLLVRTTNKTKSDDVINIEVSDSDVIEEDIYE